MRAILILNPESGVSPLAEQHDTLESNEEIILTRLALYGIEPEVWYTTLEDPGNGLATKAADEHADLVIAAGGDGTVYAVACGLIGRESTIGIIPLGTMNNLALSLNIPLSIEAACALIAKGETRTVDAGKINEHIFLESAGVGLEAALFPYVEEIKSFGFRSTLHGVMKGLFTLFAYQPPQIKLSFDNKRFRLYRAIEVTICNAPYYGPHFQLVPRIIMDDGLLDVVIFKNFSKLEYIRHAISISQGRRELQPKIVHWRVKALHIKADHPVEIHANGLPLGYTPATVMVIPGALRVCAPATNVSGLKATSSDFIPSDQARK